MTALRILARLVVVAACFGCAALYVQMGWASGAWLAIACGMLLGALCVLLGLYHLQIGRASCRERVFLRV